MNQCNAERADSAEPLSIRRILTVITASLVLFLLTTHVVYASPLEFHYSGVITSSDADTGVAPNSRFDGTFTYDPSTNPQYMMIENAHFYTFGTSLDSSALPTPDTSAISLSLDNKSLFSRSGGLAISLGEVDAGDKYNPYPHTTLQVHSYDTDHSLNIDVTFVNPSRGVFGSLDIPTAISLSDFPTATITVTQRDAASGAYLEYQGTIDTLNQVVIVTTLEPAGIALWLGLILPAYIIRRRFQK